MELARVPERSRPSQRSNAVTDGYKHQDALICAYYERRRPQGWVCGEPECRRSRLSSDAFTSLPQPHRTATNNAAPVVNMHRELASQELMRAHITVDSHRAHMRRLAI